jgi:chromate reductase, NAD(P)H dehydrogenase (quinone)
MKITIISGTNRSRAKSLLVARHVEQRYQALDIETTVLNLQELPAELLHPDVYYKKPESFAPFRDAVLSADGLVIIVPEYNGSYPGVLKYFIDLLPFPDSFENRPVAYIGISAGIWGGLRSVEHLQGVFGYRNGFNFNERVFISSLYKSLNEDGSPKEELIDQLLQSQTEHFIQFCSSLTGLR